MKKTMRKGLLSILSCLSDSVEKKGKPSDPQTFMLAVLTSQIAYIREDVSRNSSLGRCASSDFCLLSQLVDPESSAQRCFLKAGPR